MGPAEFGEWLRCADGREHHFVNGVALCGARSRVVTPQPDMARKDGGCRTKQFRCAECVNKHLGRWLTAYPKT